MKKSYITLRDRTWKGREWWSSYGRNVNIRRLTDEEAATLTDIEEWVNPLQPVQDNVVGNDDGRMFCKKCGSKKGFYVYKNHRGEQKKWYTIYKCAECGAREKRNYN